MSGPPADPPSEPARPGEHPPLNSTAPFSDRPADSGTVSQGPELLPLSPLDPTVPVFPGYEVGGLIGEGGMGLVFRARDRSLNRPTALKVVHRTGPGDLARFLAEAEAAAAVDHPNVVRVYAYGEIAGRAYLAMELCSGGTLADRIRAGPFAPQDAAALGMQISRGVAAVHALGIIHRDLKPSNVLFDVSGVPKVADFGVAKRPASDLTRSRAVMGTPAYMAPEQARGQAKAADPATDVWALGVILYQCLTGIRPFDDPDPWAVLQKVTSENPRPPRKLAPTTHRDLEAVCMKCLAKDPIDRYPTAGELADDLARFLAGEAVRARRVSTARRVYLLSRRKSVLIASAVLLALTIGLAAGRVPWWRAQRTEPAPPGNDATFTEFNTPSGVSPPPEPRFNVSAAVKEIESLILKSDSETAEEKIGELASHDEGKAKRLSVMLAERRESVARRTAEIELNAVIKNYVNLGQIEEARKWLPKLRELNPTLADQWERLLGTPLVAPADNRLGMARWYFARKMLPEGLAALGEVLLTATDPSTRQTAEGLRAVWDRARSASELPVTDAAQLAAYRKRMPDPVSYGGLSAEDRIALASFHRIDLALKIRALPQPVDVSESTRQLAEAGRELFRNRRAWADARLPDVPAAVAAGLFDRAAAAMKRPDDFAWAGICRSEVAGTSYVKLTGDLDAARDSGSSPATLVLEGLVAAREPWRTPGTWPDWAAEVAALRKASDLFQQAIAACKADKSDRTDELVLLYDRLAAVTTRLADEETDKTRKAELWDRLDAVARDFRATLPGRLNGLAYEARVLEGRAPQLSTDQRFESYPRIDRAYGWAGGLFGPTPAAALGRARILVQWTEDLYRLDGKFLDLERLNRAEALLREVTTRDQKGVQPATLAEAHYWLGRAAMLAYVADVSSSATRSKLYGEVMAAYTAAAVSAAKLDEDPWTERIVRAVFDATNAQLKWQARQQLRPIEAEAAARYLDEFADRKGPRALTPVWRAALKVRAVRLRDAVRPKAEDWFQKVRDAAEEAVRSGRDREADLRAELLVTLAEGRSARLKHRKHYDPAKAAEFAREAVKLTEARADLPAGLRANAAGVLGMALYRGDPEGWAEARTSLEKAMAALPATDSPEGGAGRGLPPGWRWRYTLGALDLVDAVAAAKTEKGVQAADLAVRAMNRLLPMRVPLFHQLLKGAADPDPDDKAIAEEFFGTEARVYEACGTYWQKVIAANKDDPRRHTWRLAAAELDWLSDPTPGRLTAAKKLAAAVKSCEAGLEKLDPKSEAAADARRLIERTKALVQSDSP